MQWSNKAAKWTANLSDGLDEGIILLVEGEGPGAVDDAAVDVGAEVDLDEKKLKTLTPRHMKLITYRRSTNWVRIMIEDSTN
jgi:hypothetical protein